MKLYQTHTHFQVDPSDGRLILKTQQFIPQEFLDECRRMRDASVGAPMGESHSLARIPEAVAQEWLKQGFDVFREDPKASLARLKAEGLDAFMTSNRSI